MSGSRPLNSTPYLLYNVFGGTKHPRCMLMSANLCFVYDPGATGSEHLTTAAKHGVEASPAGLVLTPDAGTCYEDPRSACRLLCLKLLNSMELFAGRLSGA